ncbi:MAG: corrinoid protein [candidate division WOR-3 bacterium]|nr:corrinoid protein [candidate division WOR-3 bacterium]
MDFDNIKKAVVDMEVEKVKDLVTKLLKNKRLPEEILEKGLIAGMKEVGRLFSCKEYFVPEVLMASEAFYAGFDLVSPLIKTKQMKEKGKIIIGVVEGDIHDIGKNIVKVMLEASGYQVVDLGKDVPTEIFVDSVTRENPKILAMSALMTTTMMKMKDVVKSLEHKKLRNKVKVIIGGAPVNEDFAKRIGADGYGEDASAAVSLVEALIGE